MAGGRAPGWRGAVAGSSEPMVTAAVDYAPVELAPVGSGGAGRRGPTRCADAWRCRRRSAADQERRDDGSDHHHAHPPRTAPRRRRDEPPGAGPVGGGSAAGEVVEGR